MVNETTIKLSTQLHRLLDMLEKQMVKDTIKTSAKYSHRREPISSDFKSFKFTPYFKYHMCKPNNGYEFFMLDNRSNGVHYNSPIQISCRGTIVDRLCEAVAKGEFNTLELEQWIMERAV